MSATRRNAPEYQHPRIVDLERFLAENAGASELRREPVPQVRSGLDHRTLTARIWRALDGGRSFQRPAHPNSNLVTPNSFERSIAGSGPVYIRAVSNTGIRSRAATSVCAVRLVSGMSRKSDWPPVACAEAAS